MRKYALLILVFFLIPFVASQEQCIYYFYGNGCPHCAKVEPILDSYAGQHPSVIVKKFEIYTNRTNMVLLNDYFDRMNASTQERGVPALFIANAYYTGDSPIIDNLNSIFANASTCPFSNATTENQTQKSISLLTVIGAALVDSINPCAIAVLLILLGALLATGNKKKTLYAGLSFTIAIYIAYFLFGLGLFSALRITGLAYWFAKVVGVLAIIIGLLNIKDYFWYGGGGFVMEIPRAWRPKLKSILGNVTTPLGAFAIGFVVCFFELPCTGGPYLFVLGLLAERVNLSASIPILLLYNLFFILPLLVITLGLFLGFSSVQTTTTWKDNNLRLLHLIAGIVMLTLGILVLVGIA